MKDLTITSLFFISFILSLLILGIFILRFRLLNDRRIRAEKYLKILRHRDLPYYFSSLAIILESRYKFFHLRAPQKVVLMRAAMKSLPLSASLTRHSVKKAPQNISLLLLDAEICLLLNKKNEFLHLIEQINLPTFCPVTIRAQYLHLKAHAELYQTDLLSASKHASQALKLYQRLGYTYEEAMCYQTLAQMYRISGVFDVAFTMLKDAQKIYTNLNLPAKLAETEAYYGLTELGRENYKPAVEYLNSAEKICLKHKLSQTLADICNWQGLTALLTNNLKLAQEKLCTVCKKTDSAASCALAKELLARVYLKQKKYTKALAETNEALKLYQTQKHTPGIFETLYLQAEIYYIRKDYKTSRKILTTLIKEKSPPSSIYYPANAYTLLGAVELKENNLNKARTLFKQAVDLEHAQNRLKGAAVDYNNLAELERMEGAEDKAQAYLKQAVRYAEEIEDNELKDYLKNKLK